MKAKNLNKNDVLMGLKAGEIRATASNVNVAAIAAPVEIEARTAENESKARRFSMVAYTGGPMYVDGFYHPVVVDLAGLNAGSASRPILIDHAKSLDAVLGQTDRIEVADGQLQVEGSIIGESEQAKRVIALNDKGFKFQASIGAKVLEREFVKEGSKAQVNGQTFDGPLIVARRTSLGEVSFVILGADDNTSARIAAKAAKESDMNFEQWLEARGFTLADLTDAQKASLEAMHAAENTPPQKNEGQSAKANSNADFDSIMRTEKQKEEKRSKIVNLTATALQENPGQLQIIEALGRQALEGDWEPQRYELELLRATRPQITNRTRGFRDDGLNSEVVEAALCLSGGLEEPEKAFKVETLEAAEKRWRNGIGLNEVLMLFARRNGHDVMSTRNLRPLLEAAFSRPQVLQAAGGFAVSTMSLPGILANVANKFLKRGFDSVESTWRTIAATRSVRDFKQITSYSLTGDFQYVEVPPGGELKHANVGEEVYTNQVKTFGRMFGIDRRDIINDDISAFTQVPQRLGRGGALKFNDIFWRAFMDNAAFFTAARGNYFEGATAGPTTDSRLNIDGLTRGETAFLNQTDPDGKPLAVEPRILLVPNALYSPAAHLMSSTELRNTTADTIFMTSNPHNGKFVVVRSSYLSNASYTGNSTTAWYLLADPSDMPVIEAAFLNGVQTPTVESADADFNMLGVQFRGYHDFGVALQEPRGGVKMKGAA